MRHLHLLLSSFPGHRRVLDKLAARGLPEHAVQAGLTATLDALFGTAGVLAPLLLAAEGQEPGVTAWFRADPVYLIAGMHSVSLLDSRRFRLEADEAATLVAALNAHFGEEAHFVAPHPERWYVRFGQPIEAVAPAPDQLAGVPVEPHLVTGPDAARLHRFAMEAQMLLHGLPLNEEREERGDLPINGLWFWGGGVLRTPAASFDRILADDFTARALALSTGIEHRPPPPRFEPMSGRTLAVPNPTMPPERLEADWLGPILAALKWGRLDTLVLDIPGPEGIRLKVGRRQAWKLWANRPGIPSE